MAITKDIIEAEFRTKGGSKVQKEMAEVQKNIALINNENERLRDVKAKLEAANKKGSRAWKAINDKIKENNKQLGVNKGRLRVLERQLKVSEMSAKQLKKRFFELRRELENTNKELHPERWNRLNNELQETERHLNRVRGRSNGARSSMSKLKGIASTFLPVASVAGFISVLKIAGSELFSLTKQMQGDAVRSSTVFGNQLGYVSSEAEKLADRMGLTNREFVANAAATADLLIPLDFTRQQAAKMSVELQSLTGAMDEWTGGSIGAAGVSDILTKAMLGENEGLKQLGIAIQKDSDEFRELVKVKLAAGDVTNAQAEAMATLELITKKSADAQSAYNREGNKLLRLQKSITVWWKKKKEAVVEWLSVSPVEELENEQKAVNKLVVQLRDANISEATRTKLLTELNRLAPSLATAIKNEETDVNSLTTALENYNSQMALKILMKKHELNIDKQKKKKGTYAELAVEHEAEMIEAMNNSLEWFKKKGPEFSKQVEAIMYDNTLSTISKAERIMNLSFEASLLGNNQLGSAINDYKIFRKIYAEESNLFEKMVTESEALKEKYKKIIGDPSNKKNENNEESPDPGTTGGNPDPGTTGTKTPKPKPLKPFKIADNWEEEISKDMEAAADKVIDEYLNGRDKLKQIQETYGLVDPQTVNQQALASVQALYDEQIISEQEFQAAKAAIEDDALQQSIERQLKYRILQEDGRLLDMEAEEFNYQERLVLEDDRYQAALDIEDERYALELERARGQKEMLLELENEHKKNLINVEETYAQRKADVVARQNAIEQGRLQIAAAVAGGIVSIMGQESEIGKAALVIKQGLAMAGATIDLVRGMSATAAVGFPANVPLITAFIGQTSGFIGSIMNATKSVKSGKTNFSVRGKKDGGFAGFSTSDDDPMGFYHANEFVANAKAVRNPGVREVLDIIDVAQKNGTISTIDLPRIITGQLPGKQQGGYSTEQAPAPVAYSIPPEMATILERNTQVMERIEANGVKGVWEWDVHKEGVKKMESLESDVGM
ncbi:hypothetical protein DMA11_10385 [Marinilabiliaceae bacterium JC017]|nr:hypothetical protein DMA11_10385 [Marinilabiliaceae bacterium JC017]